MSEHSWFTENLAGYSAGGLTAEERERLERHASGCAPCRKALADARALDTALDGLFAQARPEPGWENRVLESLRCATMKRPSRWKTFGQFAAGVAAAIVLGLLGAAMHGWMAEGELPFPGMPLAKEGEKGKDSKVSVLVDDSGSMANTDEINGSLATTYYNRTFSPDGRHTVSHGVNGVRLWDSETGKASQKNKEDLSDTVQKRVEDQFRVYKDIMNLARVEEKTKSDLIAGLDATQAENRLKMISGLTPSGTLTPDLNIPIRGSSFGLESYPPALALTIKSRTHSSATGGTIGGKSKAQYKITAIPDGASNQRAVVEGRDGKDADGFFSYHKLGDAGKTNVANQDKDKREKKPDEKEKGKPEDDKKDPKAAQAGEKKPAQAKPGDPANGPAPEPGNRKVIRTGEVEYEVESFEAAVKRINKMVDAIQGAVATVSSDRLANGKMRGSVVVRIPPQSLDKFLEDLGKELTKAGELKSQRIGSQDITKQYTDVESRLRAARSMEERFLNIIKTGKGEIKDLIAAERELGVWRTKIEEMEGEIRYYANQVALSTLTITLAEKEIRTASALVVTEQVKLRLEVEDVAKAQQAAVKAVTDAKGRVTRSELKQHAAGQLEAHVHFEVAPAAAMALRGQLNQLGVLTGQSADRLQQAEGGSGSSGEVKIRQNDVQFEVTLYNVANYEPRETHELQVVTRDVPGSYRKLQDAVANAKGLVRAGTVIEQDKQKVTAQFDFDIPTKDKAAIDKALADIGQVLSRGTAQKPPGENVTDRKVGYRLVLRSVASVPPREKVSLILSVKDVDRSTADLLDMVKESKGTAHAAPQQDESGKVTSVVLIDVPLSGKDRLVRRLKDLGIVRLHKATPNPQVPDNELATAHIDVVLATTGPIVPEGEGIWPQIRTSLFYSFKLISWSVMFIILGLSVVLPWALLLWAGYKLVRRMRQKASSAQSPA